MKNSLNSVGENFIVENIFLIYIEKKNIAQWGDNRVNKNVGIAENYNMLFFFF